MFTNCPGDRGSIPKLKKWYLMPLCLTLSIIRYRSRVKWSNHRKEPSPTLWCSSYSKGSLWFGLNYGCQLYNLFIICLKNAESMKPRVRLQTLPCNIYIYIYIYIYALYH